eukprot:127804_1
MSEEELLKSALNLMRRMPPASTETSISGLINLVPNLTEELLQRVDQPLKVQKDPATNRHYILCDYNRDGDSYRSPWANEYFPPLEDGFMPSDRLRKMEVVANDIFDKYRKLYFEGGFSSVYFWDLDGPNFASCWLVHKDVEELRGINSGVWDSIHVFEAVEKRQDKYEYKLTTTVMVSMNVNNDTIGMVDLSGSMTKQSTKTVQLDKNEKTHIGNMGKMVEDMELQLRNSIEGIYIQKTREVINGMRGDTAGKRLKAVVFDELSGVLQR